MAAEGLGESSTGRTSLPETLSQPERRVGAPLVTRRPQCERGRRSLLSAIMMDG